MFLKIVKDINTKSSEEQKTLRLPAHQPFYNQNAQYNGNKNRAHGSWKHRGQHGGNHQQTQKTHETCAEDSVRR